ncbi:MAG TPA: hypothetical protein DCL49_13345 [Candidatus Omnitrophica bacterium]|nr:MAG: hypothetical protein A2216_00445 [Omnitrophica WOR_2 bacterium RIFOXYA2_FULL_45_12]HAH21871.1 hypothetical protein [Candidatus Omnitrophota bacterium]HBU08419.1 hypothetical protein [Candidatus Omnitrophota bacterium]
MTDYFNAVSVISEKIISFTRRKLEKFILPFIDLDDVLAKISQKPTSLGFQVTNICNANCVFCGYQYLKSSKGILSMDLFKKAVDEFNCFGGGNITFTPIVGEPLIDPSFIEKIKYARSRQNIAHISFFTNGILINRMDARDIITSGVNSVTISIGGFDAETYLRAYRVNHWNDVYEGLLNILKENKLRGNRVDIHIGLRSDAPLSRLLGEPAYKELRRFKFKLEYNIHYDSWSGRIKQQDLKGIMRLRRPLKKTEPCWLLYSGPTILSNGDMTLCGCRDLDGDAEFVLGNIKDKTILEMWRDQRVGNIRKGFYSSRYPEMCRNCSFYNDLSPLRKEKLNKFFR